MGVRTKTTSYIFVTTLVRSFNLRNGLDRTFSHAQHAAKAELELLDKEKILERCNSSVLPSSNFSHVSVLLVHCRRDVRVCRQLFKIQSPFLADERTCS